MSLSWQKKQNKKKTSASSPQQTNQNVSQPTVKSLET